MIFTETGVLEQQKVNIKNLLPEIGIEQARQEIISGLINKNKFISSKYFYDNIGSDLFEEITILPEYYPTRTEKGILKIIASELMNRNAVFDIIELGSGDCSKISILINTLSKSSISGLTYLPVDFSYSAVEKSYNELSIQFPEIKIDGYVADFTHQLNQIPHSNKPRLICFLGSTIGNFGKKESTEILQNLALGLLDGDTLLVGFDLVKPENILHAAYNDLKGITKAFNLNILNVVNKIIKSDFNTDNFNHHSYFNRKKSRIEMHLVANQDCEIRSSFLKQPIHFKTGESIHTENSHKYSLKSIRELIVGSGLSIKNTFTDTNNWFALVELEREHD